MQQQGREPTLAHKIGECPEQPHNQKADNHLLRQHLRIHRQSSTAQRRPIRSKHQMDAHSNQGGKGLGEWIYSKPVPQTPDKDEKAFECKDSLTPGAKQRNWKIPTEFPLCPSLPVADNPLKVYLANLKSGAVFTKTERYHSLVHKADISEDGNTLAVISSQPDGVKPFALTTITFEDGCYIHTSGHTYFSEEGATKYYTLALGREWTGGDVFDDHC